jgi:hypothetical protein
VQRFLLDHVSGVPLAILFVGVATGGALAGLLVVRRNVALSTLESHNDVAGFIIAVIGVLYAVLLAFVVVIVWEQFDAARGNADHEAGLVESLYRDVGALPGDTGQVRQEIQRYAQSVADDEWKSMSTHQRESPLADAALTALVRSFEKLRPSGAGESAFYTESVKRLNDIEQARRERVLASSTALPGPLWLVLLAGAIVTIGFTYFFGVSNFRAHMLMVVALAAIIGLILFLLMALDLPFTGALAVRPSAMREVIGEFSRLAT